MAITTRVRSMIEIVEMVIGVEFKGETQEEGIAFLKEHAEHFKPAIEKRQLAYHELF